MSRKNLPASKRRSKVVSCTLTPGVHRELEKLAKQKDLGVSSYTARVLEDHVAAPDRQSTKVDDDSGAYLVTTHASATALLDAAENASNRVASILRKFGAQNQNTELAWAAGSIEATVIELRKQVFWMKWTSGLDPNGDAYRRFENAWSNGELDQAKSIALGASWESWSDDADLSEAGIAECFSAFEASCVAENFNFAAMLARRAASRTSARVQPT